MQLPELASLRLILVHGWGFDASFWRPMLDILKWPGPVTTVNLGYRGQSDPDNTLLPRDSSLMVGHSLGYLYLTTMLARRAPLNPVAMVAINGFKQFLADEHCFTGQPPTALRQLQRQWLRTPEKAWGQFLALCGPCPDNAYEQLPGNHDACAQGLKFLHASRAAAHPEVPLLALCGRLDQLVKVEHSQFCFSGDLNSELKVHNDAAHLLPLTHPAWCSRQIRGWLRA